MSDRSENLIEPPANTFQGKNSDSSLQQFVSRNLNLMMDEVKSSSGSIARLDKDAALSSLKLDTLKESVARVESENKVDHALIKKEIDALQAEMKAEFKSVAEEFKGLNKTINRWGGALVLAALLIGVAIALLRFVK